VRLLVDTHAWLWMLSAPERLPTRVRELLADQDNEILLSAASAWEIAIKHHLGRLPLPEPPEVYLPSRLVASGTTPLPIDHADALRAGALPTHHRDPFDRMLVAQAQLHEIPLASGDVALAPYDLTIVWN
jgi:PIN domain nuclease of toxin-antitoxin system